VKGLRTTISMLDLNLDVLIMSTGRTVSVNCVAFVNPSAYASVNDHKFGYHFHMSGPSMK
jgi:hypothetical protein